MACISAPTDAIPDLNLLSVLLEESAARHKHLCPRQVLGVRIGLKGLQCLGFIGENYQPRYRNEDKRLLTITETDGCGSDGIAVATDCAVGKRTLRVFDFGKVAATLVDTYDERAFRVAPSASARAIAVRHEPDAESNWHAYLKAYQVLPDHELIQVREVRLSRTISEILSKPNARAICSSCGEEVFNEREVIRSGIILCRSCAGERYYTVR